MNALRRMRRHELRDDAEDEWDVLRRPTVFRKKTVTPDKKSGIMDFFPDLKYKRDKVAVVLSGGGAKGMAHVGVLRELEKYNVDIDFISGTSMGSIIGAIYALEKNLDLVDRYLKHTVKDLITFKDFNFSLKGLVKGVVIEELLWSIYGNATFDDTKIDLVVNAVDLESGKEVVFREGKILDAVRASMSIPIIFTPKVINDKMYVDGGVANNVPYNHVPKKYKKVIVCDVNSHLPPLKKNHSALGYFYHVLSLLEHNATKVPDDKRIIWLRPDMKDITVGDFAKMKTAVEIGTREAQNVFPQCFKKIS
ncbi:MAG: patatin-like phospholipase family protein [Candidatus Woesearchaeota archaeon]